MALSDVTKALEEIRGRAMTRLPPLAMGLTREQYLEHKLNEIEGLAARALKELNGLYLFEHIKAEEGDSATDLNVAAEWNKWGEPIVWFRPVGPARKENDDG